jgi:hypothetical protein
LRCLNIARRQLKAGGRKKIGGKSREEKKEERKRENVEISVDIEG